MIIVEDDLEFSPDFFEYFEATLPLLRSDPTLWCISAWNDNGKRGLIDETKPELLYRTDFFGGLGWMITRELWVEVSLNVGHITLKHVLVGTQAVRVLLTFACQLY